MADEGEPITTLVPKTAEPILRVPERLLERQGYNYRRMLSHLHDHLLKNEWCDMACQARQFNGRNSATNRRAASRRMPSLFAKCLSLGELLVIDYAGHGNGHRGEILQVKLLRSGVQSDMERLAARRQLERMLTRKEISDQKYHRALLLLDR